MNDTHCHICKRIKQEAEFSVKRNGTRALSCRECTAKREAHVNSRQGKKCQWCSAPSEGKTHCIVHRKLIADRKRLKAAGKPLRTCTGCRVNPKQYAKKFCEECRRARHLARYVRKDADYAARCFEGYGGLVCACCGEQERVFLSIDHVENNGAAHRKEIGGSGKWLYRWLIKRNFPPGYQVLCMNCNTGKYRNGGICPHKMKREASL